MTAALWEMTPYILHYSWNRGRESFRLAEGKWENWVLIAAEEGTFSYALPDEEGEATFGDLVICRPHISLKRRIHDRLTYHVIEWNWRGPQGRRADPEEWIPAGKITLRDVDRLSSDFALLRTLDQHADPLSISRRALLLNDILHLYYAQTSRPATPRPDEAMRHAALRLQTRACEAFSMKEISDALGFSPVQFTRRFRAVYGMTPSEYRAALRLHKARDLLLATDMTVQAIAELCGYGSGLYLSRVFTRAMKLSPGRFRDAHRL